MTQELFLRSLARVLTGTLLVLVFILADASGRATFVTEGKTNYVCLVLH
ncbi:TPA_asm: hypothetical protein [ssRNA phage Esthiorhiza.4_19]|uniref:Uncharacterized protein n=2 Tax=Fiersviridae TaxID=2842319 RepID=A0A8S5L2V9_9VIRU|nr:hypothetical protein QIK83_gp1 [ssRNA phage Esthiorhiza.4_19]QDH89165.1 MAG: hypothetical protein H4RhizoLitter21717_000004 [Leviviridae sp.]DAD51693.1 TPA_asm: hypothetical protein [ssRNA phage Esthiorhiza.4_19]